MKDILKKYKNGEIDLNQCERLLKSNNILELSEVAHLDINRKNRAGFPEAIFSPSKDYDDLLLIINNTIKNIDEPLIVTKLSKERFLKLKNDLNNKIKLDYNEKGKILVINNKKIEKKGAIGIITAGTSDINIAEEAKVIVEQGGCEAIVSYDIGVAGIQRLFPKIAEMIEKNVKAIIVCAGMEGALPSVVAGIVDVPVIGVPTSVGYGVGEGGIAALYGMLQSCAPGIAVVNIDNGFGAAVFALKIFRSQNDF